MIVSVTESAKKYLKSVCPEGHVTLSIKGGGCSGMQYVWGLSKDCTDESIQWSDPIDEILVVDPMAELLLFGSQIDYVEELGGSFLKVSNPMATSSCGCGESFSA
jgi:iron-sulfur cluster insertion protein